LRRVEVACFQPDRSRLTSLRILLLTFGFVSVVVEAAQCRVLATQYADRETWGHPIDTIRGRFQRQYFCLSVNFIALLTALLAPDELCAFVTSATLPLFMSYVPVASYI
jgi:hypothetical protein